MRIFLATPTTLSGYGDFLKNMSLNNDLYILESFFYISPFVSELIPLFKDFILDSGAFTFMQNKSKFNIEVKDYLKNLINYINLNDIKNFMELDIDSLVGYEKVKEIRSILEKETNKKSIPVFHKARGLKEYEKMCEEYSYIAIGTIGEYKKDLTILKQLLKIARKYNTKVHGLGFTVLSKLKEFDFYSVDSTSWNCGNRFGNIYKFNGTTIETIHRKNNTRLITDKAMLHNFTEWVKYQKYADVCFGGKYD